MVKTILLFTLTACPTGRNIGTELNTVAARHPLVHMETRYVEIDVEETNYRSIKKNPTLLFLDEVGKELGRMTGFQEADQIEAMLLNMGRGVAQPEVLPENEPLDEEYVVYLYDGDHLVPRTVVRKNPTGVKAPRIRAIHALLDVQHPGLLNPFPRGTLLKAVQFANGAGIVTFQVPQKVAEDDAWRMEAALHKVLSHFQVTSVKMIMEEFE